MFCNKPKPAALPVDNLSRICMEEQIIFAEKYGSFTVSIRKEALKRHGFL